MKTQRYGYFALFTLLILTFSLITFAQKGRFYHGNPHAVYAYGRPYISVNVGTYGYPAYPPYPVYPSYPRCGRQYHPPYPAVVVPARMPPIGMMISTLPYGHFSFSIGPNPFYYYNGIYYRPYSGGFQIVAPPLGAVVNHLPPGAKPKVIDGEKYYELNGTYYKENLDSQDRLSYRVVATDGVLNTEREESVMPEPEIGYKTDKLPPDSRSVVIQGEKLYTTPSGQYYKKMTEGDKVYYELVGK